MPRLSCGVSNCTHNCSDQCCLNQIDVSGSSATNSVDTCCNNFMEQTGATNSLETPNTALDVSCQATNCTHNSSCKCHADTIDIAGQGACNCQDTCCGSFKEQ